MHMAGRRGDAHAAVRAGRWGACRPRVVAISAPLNACRVHGRWPRGGPGQHPTLPAASPLGKPPTRGPVAHSSATPQTLRPQRGGGAGFLPRYPRGRVLGPHGGRERRRVRTWHPLGTRGGQERSLAPGWGRRVPGMAWAGGGSEGKEHETPRARTREEPGTEVSVAGREGKRPAPGSRSCTRDRFLHRLLHEGRLRAPRKRPPVGLFLGGSRKWTSGGSGGRASPALSAQTPTGSPPLAPVALPHGEAR